MSKQFVCLLFLCVGWFGFPSTVFGQSEPIACDYIPTIEMKHPTYPPLARLARVTGVVRVEATVDPTGKVTQAKIVEGHRLLQKAAESAVTNWQFVAEPESAHLRTVVITYDFQIDPKEDGPESEVIDGETPTSFVIKEHSVLRTLDHGCQLEAPKTQSTPVEGQYWENYRLKKGKGRQ